MQGLLEALATLMPGSVQAFCSSYLVPHRQPLPSGDMESPAVAPPQPKRMKQGVYAPLLRQEEYPCLLNADPEDVALKLLAKRAGMSPADQRKLFAEECRGESLADGVARLASFDGLVVASCNIYYCRVRDGEDKEAIMPAVTFAAIDAMLAAGADVITLNEVVFPDKISGSEADCGKDEYAFEFFPQRDFLLAGDALAGKCLHYIAVWSFLI